MLNSIGGIGTMDNNASSARRFPVYTGRLSPAMFLLLAMALSWLDRSLPNVFLEAIRQEIDLTDSQLGLLTGTAFALCYAVGVLPAGWMADRWHRPLLLALGMAVWSLLTIAVAFAQTFSQLFVCRMGVGLGEAVLLPTAYSLLTDLYASKRRTRAVAIMTLGVPIGSRLALLGGANLAAWLHSAGWADATGFSAWRLVFAIIGAVGLFTSAIAVLLPEPRRAWVNGSGARKDAQDDFAGYLLRSRGVLIPLVAGATAFNMAAAGFLAWMVALLVRSHEQATATVGGVLGFTTIATGLAAAPLAAICASRRRSVGVGHSARVLLVICSALAAIGTIAASVAPSAGAGFTAAALALLAIFTATAILPVVIMGVVEPAYVARASSILIFCASVFGTASGPFIIGSLSDRVFGGGTGLSMAVALGTGVLLVFAALCFTLIKGSVRDSD